MRNSYQKIRYLLVVWNIFIILLSNSYSILSAAELDSQESGSGNTDTVISSGWEIIAWNSPIESRTIAITEGSTGMTSSGINDRISDINTQSGKLEQSESTNPPTVSGSLEKSTTPIESGATDTARADIIENFIDPDVRNQELWYIEWQVLIKLKEENAITVSSFIESTNTTQIHDSQLQVTDVMKDENVILLSTQTWSDTLEMMIHPTDIPSTKELIDRYKDDPRVEIIQPNYLYYPQSIPNDTSYPSQWSLYNKNSTWSIRADIHYPEAIDFLSKEWLSSKPTVVAVVDMGVAYDHPDLKSMMWDGSTCKSHTWTSLWWCVHGFDFQNNDKDPRPSYGTADFHGTHVAWTIWAETNNGKWVTGVGGNIEIMSLRVLWNQTLPYTTTLGLVDAINFAKYNNAKVINASIWAFMNPAYMDSIDLIMYYTIRSFPGLFVAAAWNNGADTDTTFFYPAWYTKNITLPSSASRSELVTLPWLDNIISVWASTEDDTKAYFSNYGKDSVDIEAPWVNIISTMTARTDYFSSSAINLNGWQTTWGDSESWTGRLDSSWALIWLNGVPLVWWDTRVPYKNTTNTNLIRKIENTTNLANIRVSFDTWCDTPSNQSYLNPRDYISFDYSYDGESYLSWWYIYESLLANRSSIDSYSWASGVREYYINMASNSQLFLRFGWITDNQNDIDTWWKDFYGCGLGNITVSGIDNWQWETYWYLAWTSMATPHVSWAAGLAWSYFPDKSYKEIRDAILAGGDTIPALSWLNRTGKRLNISWMLQILQHSVNTIINWTGSTISLTWGEVTIKNTTTDPISTIVAYSDKKDELVQNPYIQYAQKLYDNAVIDTFTNASLTGQITRWEFAIILAKVLWKSPVSCIGNIYSDVKTLDASCWYIEALVGWNLLKKNFSYFLPNNNISRIEAISLLSYGLKIPPSASTKQYTDIKYLWSELSWYIGSLSEKWCLPSRWSISPLSVIERGEAFRLIACARYGTLSPAGSSIDLPMTDHQYILSGLIPDRDYYYYISPGTTLPSNSDPSGFGTFFLPYILSESFTGTFSTKNYIQMNLSGSKITFYLNNSGNITLSGTTLSSINLSLSGLSLEGYLAWWGKISGPSLLSTNTVISASGGSKQADFLYNLNGTSWEPIRVASGKIRVQLETSSGSENMNFDILSSTGEWVPYSSIGVCTNKNSICEFLTTDLAKIALVNLGIAPPSPSPPPSPNPPLPTCTLTINPGVITDGSWANLAWNILNTATGILSPGNTILSGSGTMTILPRASSTTLYTLTVINITRTGACNASVISNAPAPSPNPPSPTPAPTISLSAVPATIDYNTTTSIIWSSTGAVNCTSSWGSALTGGVFTTPKLINSTTYSLSCSGSGGTTSGSTLVTVRPVVINPIPTPKPTCSIKASANNIVNGNAISLTWQIQNTQTGMIYPGNILVESSGSLTVSPSPNTLTDYSISLTNSWGTGSCMTTVISSAPSGPGWWGWISAWWGRGGWSSSSSAWTINSTPNIVGTISTISQYQDTWSSTSQSEVWLLYDFITWVEFDTESIPLLIALFSNNIRENTNDKMAKKEAIFTHLYKIRAQLPGEKRYIITAIITWLRRNIEKKSLSGTIRLKNPQEKNILSVIIPIKRPIKDRVTRYIQHADSILRSSTMNESPENILFFLQKNESVEVVEIFWEWSEATYRGITWYIKKSALGDSLSTSSLSSIEEHSQSEKLATIIVDHSTFVRNTPDITSKINGVLYNGDRVTIGETIGTWIEVLRWDLRGYIQKIFLKK